MDIAGVTSINHGPLWSGYKALQSGAWEDAKSHFQAALAHEETPDALEGLGLALWWLNDLDAAFDVRERAYLLYHERGDQRSAARVATWLAWDYAGVRGQIAVANGWLQRAHSLLDGQESSKEYGWLALREAENAILWAEDPTTARTLAARAVEIGRTLGLTDLYMYGIAIEGFALVSEGRVTDGMRRLDEATTAAISGEMGNRTAIGSTCCCLIFACERVRDYDRALQWCEQLKEFCERTGYVPMLGVCRSHYAGVLIWGGQWQEAESELDMAIRTLQATRPAFLVDALARLGSLRYRQGRLEEAVALLEQASHFPPAQLVLGVLALDLGEPDTALDYANRYLRRIPPENRTELVAGLDLLGRANVALGKLTAAQAAHSELQAITDEIATDPLRATTKLLAGVIAAAQGDHETGRRCLEDAIDMLARAGAPFELGQARIELAVTLHALGRTTAARREARAAMLILSELGAQREAARAEALLHHLEPSLAAPHAEPAQEEVLTSRQREVLKLIAQGLSDQQIAEQLVLSQHTVHRHVTNILAKLDAPSRAAAVAQAVREKLI